MQILADREALQKEIDQLMAWIKETEKQLKSPLKLRLKPHDVVKQLDKVRATEIRNVPYSWKSFKIYS